MLLLGLTACITGRGTEFTTERMSGETSEYSIDVLEYFYNGFCSSREITLRERAGTHIDPNHISHVRATDTNCNDIFDQFYFRYLKDERVDRDILTGDLINMYYMLWAESR